jgi:hypothetical protein
MTGAKASLPAPVCCDVDLNTNLAILGATMQFHLVQ